MVESPDSLASLKKLVADCFAVRPGRYWADLLGTALLAWGTIIGTELLWAHSRAAAALAYVVSVFALYRGIMFIHELIHRDRDELPGFSLAWNLLFGIPWGVPSFTFRGIHTEHHKKATYGTRRDFEYLQFGSSPFWTSVAFASRSFAQPIAIVLRFALLAPLSVLVPPLRRIVVLHLSALSFRLDIPRAMPTGRDLRNWRVQELLCFAWIVTVLAVLPLGSLLHVYGLMVGAMLVNAVRTPISHRYDNASETELTFTEQVLDSVNIDGGFTAELFCPLGFRYHALHHLFPAIPYHQLGVAHRRLRAELPADSLYHATVERHVGTALLALWRGSSVPRWRLTQTSRS
jgi:fatty acid desaturase